MPQIMAVWSAEAVPKMGNRIRETETSQMPSRWPVYRRKGVQFNNAGGPVMIMYFVSNTLGVVTQCGKFRILREINFSHFEAPKTAILTVGAVLKFEVQSLQNC